MAKTCYICGARTKHPNNATCGFPPCKAEHLRRDPEARAKERKKRDYIYTPRPTKKPTLLYDSKLQIQ